MSEKSRRVILQVRTVPIPKNEPFKLYDRMCVLGPGFTAGVYTNPSYSASDLLGVPIWTLATDADHRVEIPTPDLTHAIVNTENT
jgi:hypothetical protein